MDKNNTRTIVRLAALVIVFVALVLMEEPTSIPVCNINANTLEKCRPAVTGNNPPPPGIECCIILQAADLECVCKFKSHIPILATKSSKVHDLLRKCAINTIPPACQALKN
ncbi:LOW QUALITY PROTEIN: putative lipid-transfer protein DIR1 [Raphanus sativus]|uniref:LOW QUALITY PROTEIN: putative lipid-transfer protein DIR1 n=1 Tax=Raphanus sativus TaxID=3726 RepID=A0A6J0L4T9_RAPSA|nr:LOW QUALITY PROTEIN: putative lipid-transfer protein DIR1 [Raphanus sativus]